MAIESGKYKDNDIEKTFEFENLTQLTEILENDSHFKNGFIELYDTGSTLVFNHVHCSDVIAAIKTISKESHEAIHNYRETIFNTEDVQ